MIKHTWLTKPRNSNHVPSNLSGKLICGSFGWDWLVHMHPKEVKLWLVCRWKMNSWSILFSYSKFLRTTRISSMDIETSSLDDFPNKKTLRTKTMKIGLMGNLFKLSWAWKQTWQQDLPKDRTKACLFLNPDYETNKTKNKNNTCARKEFNKILLQKTWREQNEFVARRCVQNWCWTN